MVCAADTHPLQNLKILKRLRAAGLGQAEVQAWAAQANTDGLTACEALLANVQGPFCFGEAPGIADIFLIPQLASARRFGVDVASFPHLLAREVACLALPAFADAAPDRQPDAE